MRLRIQVSGSWFSFSSRHHINHFKRSVHNSVCMKFRLQIFGLSLLLFELSTPHRPLLAFHVGFCLLLDEPWLTLAVICFTLWASLSFTLLKRPQLPVNVGPTLPRVWDRGQTGESSGQCDDEDNERSSGKPRREVQAIQRSCLDPHIPHEQHSLYGQICPQVRNTFLAPLRTPRSSQIWQHALDCLWSGRKLRIY